MAAHHYPPDKKAVASVQYEDLYDQGPFCCVIAIWCCTTEIKSATYLHASP